jgi:hypothetical protein
MGRPDSGDRKGPGCTQRVRRWSRLSNLNCRVDHSPDPTSRRVYGPRISALSKTEPSKPFGTSSRPSRTRTWINIAQWRCLGTTESVRRYAKGSLERTAEMSGVAESPFHRNFGNRSIPPNVSECDATLRKTTQSNPCSNGCATLAEKQMQISNRNAVCPGNR